MSTEDQQVLVAENSYVILEANDASSINDKEKEDCCSSLKTLRIPTPVASNASGLLRDLLLEHQHNNNNDARQASENADASSGGQQRERREENVLATIPLPNVDGEALHCIGVYLDELYGLECSKAADGASNTMNHQKPEPQRHQGSIALSLHNKRRKSFKIATELLEDEGGTALLRGILQRPVKVSNSSSNKKQLKKEHTAIDHRLLFNLVETANYMDMPHLLHICCAHIATVIMRTFSAAVEGGGDEKKRHLLKSAVASVPSRPNSARCGGSREVERLFVDPEVDGTNVIDDAMIGSSSTSTDVLSVVAEYLVRDSHHAVQVVTSLPSMMEAVALADALWVTNEDDSNKRAALFSNYVWDLANEKHLELLAARADVDPITPFRFRCSTATNANLHKAFAPSRTTLSEAGRPSLSTLQVLHLERCLDITDEGVKDSICALSALRVLSLAWCYRITDGALAAIAASLSDLETLDISGCIEVTDNGIKALALVTPTAAAGRSGSSTLRNLSTLTLSSCKPLTDVAIEHLAYSTDLLAASLTSLDLSKCVEISDEGVSLLVRSLPKLYWLSLSGCVDLSMLAFKAIVHHSGDRTEDDILSGAALPLEHLDLTRCASVVSNNTLQNIGAPEKFNTFKRRLKSLNISQCDQLEGETCKKLLSLQQSLPLADHLQITTLNFFKCYGVGDELLQVLGSAALPLLQVLSLESCDKITNAGIGYLCGVGVKEGKLGDDAEQKDPSDKDGESNSKNRAGNRISSRPSSLLPRLESLNLSGCKALTDVAMMYVGGEGCFPRLQHLTLRNCGHITDVGILYLTGSVDASAVASSSTRDTHTKPSSSWPFLPFSLISLDLSFCTKVTTQAFLSMSRGVAQTTDGAVVSWPHLKQLTLDGCTMISDAAMKAIMTACPNVETLSLNRSGTKFISDAGLESMLTLATTGSSEASSMQSIGLAWCSAITDRGIIALSIHLATSLTVLDLTMVSSLTDKVVTHGITRLESLAKLNLNNVGNITAAKGFPALARNIHLTWLSCTSTQMSDAALAHLGSALKKLEFLCVLRCKSVSKDGVALIKMKVPSLFEVTW